MDDEVQPVSVIQRSVVSSQHSVVLFNSHRDSRITYNILIAIQDPQPIFENQLIFRGKKEY